jgi:hypothetical protein
LKPLRVTAVTEYGCAQQQKRQGEYGDKQLWLTAVTEDQTGLFATVKQTKANCKLAIELSAARQKAKDGGAKKDTTIDFKMNFMCLNLSCSNCGVVKYKKANINGGPKCNTRGGNSSRCFNHMALSISTGDRVDAARRRQKVNANAKKQSDDAKVTARKRPRLS